VAGLQRGAPEPTATLDVDATLLESHQQEATVAYDGTPGYQPVVVLWAEQDVVLHDEFRDGHVPAGCGNVRVLERAVAALPAGVQPIRVRGDSALYESAVLRWCEAHAIEYAISALKRLTLPGDFRTARPKRLRFLLFNAVGKVVRHARQTLLRLTGAAQHALLVRVRHRITALAPA
jgi:hypothetical protein